MSVYRRTYTVGGKRRTSRYYTIDFVGPAGRQYRHGTKLTTRAAAEKQERDERAAIDKGHVGILDQNRAKEPLLTLIDQYRDHLDTLKRDDMYAYNSAKRLRKLVMEAGWRCLADITVASFNVWRASGPTSKGRRIGPKTINQYLDHARAFLEWCRKAGYSQGNPLADAEHAQALDNPYYRRAATEEELRKLLAVAPESRRTAYAFQIYCPLRRDTIRHLRWNDLHLEGEKPWGVIRPEIIKTRKPERFPIPKQVAAMLLAASAKAKPSALVFPNLPTLDELRADLLAAGIAFSDKHGLRRLDFHAFRKTAIAMLKKAGVPLDQARLILHHKHVATTQKYYDEEPDPVAINAVAKMPDVTNS